MQKSNFSQAVFMLYLIFAVLSLLYCLQTFFFCFPIVLFPDFYLLVISFLFFWSLSLLVFLFLPLSYSSLCHFDTLLLRFLFSCFFFPNLFSVMDLWRLNKRDSSLPQNSSNEIPFAHCNSKKSKGKKNLRNHVKDGGCSVAFLER